MRCFTLPDGSGAATTPSDARGGGGDKGGGGGGTSAPRRRYPWSKQPAAAAADKSVYPNRPEDAWRKNVQAAPDIKRANLQMGIYNAGCAA
jgi:pyruvate/2-oxoglutarate dehydrogenase complex dihydrolipoamide acyltransferase (E2) component